MPLSLEEVVALAPDDASAKAARGLAVPGKWPLLGADAAAAWGECQGSGAKPYQTQVDFAGPAFRCTCPSRKFPCKHGLALLMLQAQDASRFASAPVPAWVSEWLASRADKAQKKEERETAKAVAAADPQAAARREAQRWPRIEGAGRDLQRFLADQLARGLGALDASALTGWQTMAARMVDAQAPGLGARLLEAAAGVRQGEDWPERTLHRLGLLQLACDALARRESLAPALQAELRTVAGWPHDQAEVGAQGERVADCWDVLGLATEERDKLCERRVWLQGRRSGRRAWLLDHAFAGRGFEDVWLPGSASEAALAFFPGASALRALVVERGAAAEGGAPASSGDAAEWGAVAARVAASPWVGLHPLVQRGARVQRDVDGLWLCTDDRAWPLALADADAWRLLASTGGHAVDVAGEWDGFALRPLTAWQGGAAAPAWIKEPA